MRGPRLCHPAGDRLATLVPDRIQAGLRSEIADILGWPARTGGADTPRAGSSHVRDALAGEATPRVGGPVHEVRRTRRRSRHRGPLECMPSKAAESQLFRAAEEASLISLTVPDNGDPADAEALDPFAFEVRALRAEARRSPEGRPASAGLPLQPASAR